MKRLIDGMAVGLMGMTLAAGAMGGPAPKKAEVAPVALAEKVFLLGICRLNQQRLVPRLQRKRSLARLNRRVLLTARSMRASIVKAMTLLPKCQ